MRYNRKQHSIKHSHLIIINTNYKKRKIHNYGIEKPNTGEKILSFIVEKYISVKGYFPNDEFINDKLPKLLTDATSTGSNELVKFIKENMNSMLEEYADERNEFENLVHDQWGEILGNLEVLIIMCFESVNLHSRDIYNKDSDDCKLNVLMQLHARALRVSNEILTLLKTGYGDGANSRWRTLYELSVISAFLSKNEFYVTKRYMEHEIIRTYKDIKEYQNYYERLHPDDDYIPNTDNFEKIKEQRDELIEKYGKEFDYDWGWIPKEICKPYFKALAKFVNVDHLIPYYNLSSASIHGLSRGLYNTSLPSEKQEKILHWGASNYGLGETIQNTAISICQATTWLLTYKPSMDSIIYQQTLEFFMIDMKNSILEMDNNNYCSNN